MRNIEVILKSDYINETDDNFRMSFYYHSPADEKEIGIRTKNERDNSIHDFSLTKDEYLFLKEQFDKYFDE